MSDPGVRAVFASFSAARKTRKRGREDPLHGRRRWKGGAIAIERSPRPTRPQHLGPQSRAATTAILRRLYHRTVEGGASASTTVTRFKPTGGDHRRWRPGRTQPEKRRTPSVVSAGASPLMADGQSCWRPCGRTPGLNARTALRSSPHRVDNPRRTERPARLRAAGRCAMSRSSLVSACDLVGRFLALAVSSGVEQAAAGKL